jgi:predicted RNA-binding Zn-ribbon protein involved in translation (DUF1610 family)
MSDETKALLLQYDGLDTIIRDAITHRMSASHRKSALDAISAVVEIIGLSVAIPPVPMILTCPSCGERHLDEGDFAAKVHHTHACQHCGMVWRPALVATVGVQFLPGFKNG